MKSKYIIVEDHGLEVPIVFCPLLQHKDVAKPYSKVISAGFCSVHKDINDVTNWKCWGESISLKLDSRPEDEEVLTKLLAFG